VRARPGSPGSDAGAAAVEFALLLPLLMMFLFGVIQYGYGLFQLQIFNSTVADASRVLATGIGSCPGFTAVVTDLAGTDGLDPRAVSHVTVHWLDPDGHPLPQAQRLGFARVTASYQPFRIGLPFLPFPAEFTRSRTVTVQDIGQPGLPGC